MRIQLSFVRQFRRVVCSSRLFIFPLLPFNSLAVSLSLKIWIYTYIFTRSLCESRTRRTLNERVSFGVPRPPPSCCVYVIHVDIWCILCRALNACRVIDTRLNQFFSSSVFSRHQTSNRVHCAFIELCVSQSMRVNKMCVFSLRSAGPINCVN